MTTQKTTTPKKTERKPTDYTSPKYWNGLVKMSMSKFFVLCVLNTRSMHGYEITKAVDVATDSCCSPTPGALYPVLREFEEGGYVTYIEEVVNGRGRKVYTITDKGREAFRVATEVWVHVAKCATAASEGQSDTEGCC